MGTRVPVQQYSLRSANSYIDETSLHDLNTVDGRGGEIIEPLVDRDAVTDESLDNEDDSGAVVSFKYFVVYSFYWLCLNDLISCYCKCVKCTICDI